MSNRINHYLLFFMVLLLTVMLPACKYRKGSRYNSVIPGDSLQYLVLDKGSGEKMSRKAAMLKFQHEYKGNICEIKYISDSVKLDTQKGILLLNTSMPEVENDILTKGFFGSFTSKQVVVYLLVSYPDFEKYFRETELVKE
ncbi:MAG: hypothetical protein JW830_06145 [Bacteroidales bacterium]|nr:hypothetical protein [Bacteroidales bacterium]